MIDHCRAKAGQPLGAGEGSFLFGCQRLGLCDREESPSNRGILRRVTQKHLPAREKRH